MIERAPKLFLQIIKNRFDLFSLELQEEKIRIKQQIALIVFGSVLGVTGLIGLGILLIYILPTADRILVASIIVAVLILVSVVSLILAGGLSKRHTPFEATLAMLNKDIHKT